MRWSTTHLILVTSPLQHLTKKRRKGFWSTAHLIFPTGLSAVSLSSQREMDVNPKVAMRAQAFMAIRVISLIHGVRPSSKKHIS